MQPGGWRQVTGVAPPLGSAAHLDGQRRVPGSRPTRGSLPILKGSGHCGRWGISGVLGDLARGRKRSSGRRRGACSAARARCRCGGLSACAPGPGSLEARPSSRRGGGGGEGAEEEGGERGGAAGGWGPRAAGRRAEGAGRAPGAGLARCRARGSGVCSQPPALGPRLLAPQIRAATSPGGRQSTRLSPGSGRGPSKASSPAGLAWRTAGWVAGQGSADPQTLPFFLLCNPRSPKLWLGRHYRPHRAGRPGGHRARYAPALLPRASSSFHSVAQDRGGGSGDRGAGSTIRIEN